jgi:four helix bundle protein
MQNEKMHLGKREHRPNPIRDRSYAFALKIVNFCTELQIEHEYVISKQLLKSGTSIGANVEEALHAESRADFIHKLGIALKEAHETDYWLRLVRDSGKDPSSQTPALREELNIIISLLTSIIKTAKQNSGYVSK